MVKIPYIINKRGERELFSVKKVERAAKRVGASDKLAKEIAKKIETDASDGVTTTEIYKQVRTLLREQTPVAAIRFSLKEAMRKMGPAGFYFEKFITAIYENAGYLVKINQIVAGKCISDYEIDFLSEKPGVLKIGECKYRNKPGDKVDLSAALANYARFLDIKNGAFLKKKEFQMNGVKSVIVTNAKFSLSAIEYSKCMGVELLGWRYPTGYGLEMLIDKYQLYPVTVLPSLSRHLAEVFAQKDVMLVKDILSMSASTLAKKAGVSSGKVVALAKEAELLLA